MYKLTCIQVPGVIVFNMVRMLPVALIWRLNIKQAIVCAIVRSIFKVLTPRQAQAMMPSSHESYKLTLKEIADANPGAEYAEVTKEDIQELKTDSPSSLMWVGNRSKASKVVLFFHGGGYILPASPSHVRWAMDAYVMEGKRAGVNVACALLQYGLAPTVQAPHQLQQALASLQAVLDLGFKPSDIIIGGDSAGANLSMQLLIHLRHKSKTELLSTITLLDVKLEEPLLGAFQISTFLSRESLFKMTSGPLVEMFSLGIVKGLTEVTTPSGVDASTLTQARSSLCALDGDLSCFDDLDQSIKNIYISNGEYELFGIDSIKLMECLTSRCKGVNVVARQEPKGVHDILTIEYFSPGDKGGAASQDLKKWVRSLWA